jgi:hypothetical protein
MILADGSAARFPLCYYGCCEEGGRLGSLPIVHRSTASHQLPRLLLLSFSKSLRHDFGPDNEYIASEELLESALSEPAVAVANRRN